MTRPSVFDVETEQDSDLCPEPGVYRGVSFTEYCQWDACNHSKLKRIDKSPLHCRELPSYEKSAAIRLGQLVHAGKLEPDSVDSRYAVMPQFELSPENKTGKGEQSTSTATAYCKAKREAFTIQANKLNCTIVSQAEYDQYKTCLAAMLENHQVTSLVNDGESEVSIVWHDRHTGLRCKARLDSVSDVLLDLKTSRDDGDFPLPLSFDYSLWKYSYYTQAAFYQDGWEAVTGQRLPFWFAVVSTNAPIQCIAAPIGEMTLNLGRDKNTERMSLYAQCKASGIWPGYESPELFELPERYFPDEVM